MIGIESKLYAAWLIKIIDGKALESIVPENDGLHAPKQLKYAECSCSILEESGFYFNIAYCFFVCFHWCLFTKGPLIILSAVSLCKALLRRSYLFVYIWSLFPRLVQFSSWPLPTGRICNQARWQTQTSSFLTSSPAASAAQQGHWYFCKSRLWVVIYI